jgi:[protein-PII] uridylyltransferase
VAVDTFHLNDAAGEAVRDERRWEQVTSALRRALRGQVSVEEPFATQHRSLPAPAGAVRVSLDNSLSDTHTVVEVKAPDRVGLLYAITGALAQQGLNVATAKIATERDQAYDAFYVTDGAGRKIEAPARASAIRDALRRALEVPETRPGPGETPIATPGAAETPKDLHAGAV